MTQQVYYPTTPELEIRADYVIAMLNGDAHPYAIYSQVVRVASIALDLIGRETSDS